MYIKVIYLMFSYSIHISCPVQFVNGPEKSCIKAIHLNQFVLLVSDRVLFSLLQSCLSGPTQGDQATFCHEEDQQAKPDAEEPDPAGLRRERHPDLR